MNATQMVHEAPRSEETQFSFGQNWARFLQSLDQSRIRQAELSLQEGLGAGDLSGKTLLDVGCGSGLFSLAARRMGAQVYSFDYDPHSVGCAQMLRERYGSDDSGWRIQRGSALDDQYMESLGQFDVVYSWGVLHHTGDMWLGLELTARRVCPGGRHNYHSARGMSPWHDLVDWVGGYPFRAAKPEQVFQFCAERGFRLTGLKTAPARSGAINLFSGESNAA